ncbi:MAG TPA: bifunctional adenosylcobinamide kinase/adenosylcobinamide-phosphate guanylyltransferase [Gaiellaceae bacterium]|nr:bifunctional adenosylcobinamide kinase/adenosylcobinamide-phosphate guanylyltransferase [Gaiellaceae bacterium]
MSLVVLLGGARAGKSALAVGLAREWDGPVVYIATAEAGDDEMALRISRHRDARPEDWWTIEEPVALREALVKVDAGAYAIVDCLTLWVANLLERGADVLAEAEETAEVAAARESPTIVITNEVGLGIVPATPLGREYRDLLGAVNATFVARAGEAVLVVAGRALPLLPDWRPRG